MNSATQPEHAGGEPGNEPSEGETLQSLREAIRVGLDSGPAEPWRPDDIKEYGRAKRAAQKAGPEQ